MMIAPNNSTSNRLGAADPPPNRCNNCRFWRMFASQQMGKREVFLGLCRYYPPNRDNGQWPVTLEIDLCTCHGPKDAAKTAEEADDATATVQ